MKKSLSRNEHKNKNKQADRVSYSVTSPNRAPTSVGLLLIDKNNHESHLSSHVSDIQTAKQTDIYNYSVALPLHLYYC